MDTKSAAVNVELLSLTVLSTQTSERRYGALDKDQDPRSAQAGGGASGAAEISGLGISKPLSDTSA